MDNGLEAIFLIKITAQVFVLHGNQRGQARINYRSCEEAQQAMCRCLM